MKIKTKLTAITQSILITSIVVISLIGYYSSRNAIISNVEEALNGSSNLGSNLIHSRIQEQFGNLQTASNHYALLSRNGLSVEEALQQLRREYNFQEIGLSDKSLKGTFSNGDSIDLSDREYLKEALKGKTVISDILVSKSTQSLSIVIATPIVNREGAQSFDSILFAQLPGSFLTEITGDIKYGEHGYSWMVNKEGNVVAHDNLDLVFNKRNFIQDAKTNPDFLALGKMVERMIAGKTGTDRYFYNGQKRMFAFSPIEGTKWSIAVGATESDALKAINKAMIWQVMGAVGLFVLGFFVVYFVSSIIASPIREIAKKMEEISSGDGDLTQRITITGKDEISDLAKAFNTFVERVHKIVQEISENVVIMNQASEELSLVSTSIASSTEEMTGQSNSVAAAVEESSVNLTSISASSEEMSASLTIVASAVEELSASIKEIENSCVRESNAAQSAYSKAQQSSQNLSDLRNASKEIGKVVEIINQIADQTNLLALNATIEAASAGEAGKGFAVVANEVKDLAKQTANATHSIQQQIEGMQQETDTAIDAITEINDIIEEFHKISQSNVVAVEQQTGAVSEIAHNVSTVNDEANEVSKNVNESSVALNEVAHTVNGLNDAVGDANQGVHQINDNVESLVNSGEALKTIVGQFKI